MTTFANLPDGGHGWRDGHWGAVESLAGLASRRLTSAMLAAAT